MIGACGGRLAPSEGSAPSTTDASAPKSSGSTSPSSAPSGGFVPPSASSGDPSGNPYPPVANGPDDSDCAKRAVRDCCVGDECDSPTAAAQFQTMVDDCAGESYFCGDVYADFDPAGCAVDLRIGEASAKFVTCVTTLLDGERWSCLATATPAQLHGSEIASCTVP